MELYKPIRFFTFILVLLLVISSCIFYIGGHKKQDVSKKVNIAHIQQIYDRLAVNSGQQDIPPLIVLDVPVVNAWTDGAAVTFTTGILAVMENDDEIAMVLAHEMAHAINHDPSRGYADVNSNDTEAHADKMGAFIMMRAGFNECRGKEVFRVFKRLFGDTANPTGHPDFAYRFDQLDLPMCHVFN